MNIECIKYNPKLIKFFDKNKRYIPRRLLFCGKTQSGKSHRINELLRTHCKDFHNIFIISPNYTDDEYKKNIDKQYTHFKINLNDNMNECVISYIQSIFQIIDDDINKNEEENKKNIVSPSLLILEDCINNKLANHYILSNLFNNSRHIGLSIMISSQSLSFMLNSIIKNNIDCIFFFKSSYQQNIILFKQQFLNIIIFKKLNNIKDMKSVNKYSDDFLKKIFNDKTNKFPMICISMNYNFINDFVSNDEIIFC